jgi:hypothetical protein
VGDRNVPSPLANSEVTKGKETGLFEGSFGVGDRNVPSPLRILRSGAGCVWRFGCGGEMRGGFCISVVRGAG